MDTVELMGTPEAVGQVERIVIPEGDQRCPLEQIVAPAHTAVQVETLLRQHFAEMQKRRMERADG